MNGSIAVRWLFMISVFTFLIYGGIDFTISKMDPLLNEHSQVSFADDQVALVDDQVAFADDDDDEDKDERKREGKQKSPYKDVFEQVGKLAMIFGAISFTWFLMKKKLASKVVHVRKFAKWFYQAHIYTGWLAFGLVAAHGTYFALTKWEEDDVITGLIAAGILVVLVVMGIVLKSRRDAKVRKAHFVLAIVWLIAAMIHTTDTIPMILLVLGGSWGIIWLFERRERQLQNG